MSALKRLTGSSAKTRRGDGWGGKGSVHPSAKRQDHRRYVPYRDRRDWNGWKFVDRPKPHCGAKERWWRLDKMVAKYSISEDPHHCPRFAR